MERFAYLLKKFALLLGEVDLGCPLAGSYLGHYSAAGSKAVFFFHLRTDYNLMNGGVRVRSPHSAQVLLVCSKRELLGNDSFI